MIPHAAIRERYMRDRPQLRLGGLASNLARITSFSVHAGHKDEVARLIEESAFFIEWTASDVDAVQRVALLDLQRTLVGWRRSWDSIWEHAEHRAEVAEAAADWSTQLLRVSGLLPE
jgi:hypothetical protein